MTKEEFMVKSRELFGNRFSYMKVPSKISMNTRVILTCSVHGDFEVVVKEHLSSMVNGGCYRCRADKHNKYQKDKSKIKKIKMISDMQYINRSVQGAIYENKTPTEDFEDYIDKA